METRGRGLAAVLPSVFMEQQIPGLWQEDQFSEHLLSIGWCGRQSCDAQECTVGGGRKRGREGVREGGKGEEGKGEGEREGERE